MCEGDIGPDARKTFRRVLLMPVGSPLLIHDLTAKNMGLTYYRPLRQRGDG